MAAGNEDHIREEDNDEYPKVNNKSSLMQRGEYVLLDACDSYDVR
jgi:hypothetical protein